ncbi:helix-turn-helix transcriptional regulator [Paraburkholderia sediminicola]|uniref:helix-turn-helix domain-containing protein n=1 Tax=Paraburkholderia sediminicola TaxID=458836 RepID=UPI0038B89622
MVTAAAAAGVAGRIGQAILRERTARELTQEQLAELVGVEQETISRFERGLVLPPLPRLIRLADIFELSLEALLRGTTNRTEDVASDIAQMLGQLDDDGRDFVRSWVAEMCERLPHRRKKRIKRKR